MKWVGVLPWVAIVPWVLVREPPFAPTVFWLAAAWPVSVVLTSVTMFVIVRDLVVASRSTDVVVGRGRSLR